MRSLASKGAVAWSGLARRLRAGHPKRRRFGADRRGVVAVETALVFGLFFVPLFLGGADAAMLMKTEVQLEGAVRSAVFFAYSSSANANDAAGVENAARVGYGSGGPALSVAAPMYAYYCITPTGTEASGTAVASATVSCPSGQSVGTWISISVTAEVTLPVSIAPFPASVPLSAGATVRVG